MNDINDLLKMKVPAYRQAYSDRTCWLMACLSELAYIRFNPLLLGSKRKDYFLKMINSLIDENRQDNLAKLIDTVAYDYQKEITCRPPHEYFDGYGINKGIEFINEWEKKMEIKKEIKL